MTSALFERLLAASSSIEAVTLDVNGEVKAANSAFADHAGLSGSELQGRTFSEFLTAPDADRVKQWLIESPPTDPVQLNFVTADGTPYTLRCLVERGEDRLWIIGEPDVAGDRTAADELMRLNNELATMARERARRERELERTRQKLQAALDEIETSYWHLQKIQEVLPLCMQCGKVKTDEARWQTVADYLRENEIFLSHGYCPGCAEAVLREHGLLEAESQT